MIPTAANSVPTDEKPAVVFNEANEYTAPNGFFRLRLPAGFRERTQPIVHAQDLPSLEGGTFVSADFISAEPPAKLVVSLTRGPDANEQLQSQGPANQDIEYEVQRDIWAEAEVLVWTEPSTSERAMAWAADATTVMWVYAIGMKDEDIEDVVSSIRVAPL